MLLPKSLLLPISDYINSDRADWLATGSLMPVVESLAQQEKTDIEAKE